VKKLFMGVPVEKAISTDAMSDPQSIEYFVKFADKVSALREG